MGDVSGGNGVGAYITAPCPHADRLMSKIQRSVCILCLMQTIVTGMRCYMQVVVIVETPVFIRLFSRYSMAMYDSIAVTN